MVPGVNFFFGRKVYEKKSAFPTAMFVFSPLTLLLFECRNSKKLFGRLDMVAVL